MNWLEGHIRTVAELSGLPVEDVRNIFQREVHISLDPDMCKNNTYRLAYSYAINLLSRIFPSVCFDTYPDIPHLIMPWGGGTPLVKGQKSVELQLVFGRFPRIVKADRIVSANCKDWQVYIDHSMIPTPNEEWNPVLALVTACYAASRVTKILLGDAIDGADTWKPFSILDYQHGKVQFDWHEPLQMDDLFVAGVGAIGSAMLFALNAHGKGRGNILLLDHDILENKNLGRYTFFDIGDIGGNKAIIAKRRLESNGLAINVEAIDQRFENYFNDKYEEDPRFRIPRLISAPDRRDTRRKFQSKLPREVWDASTGPDQVVLHYNKFDPQAACLCCIYPEDPIEDAHFHHVAEVLGISFERVRSGEPISATDFEIIQRKYPNLTSDITIGRAFDSVFRDLCSVGKLRGADKGVLAPFPFISGLAGVMLYFEYVKRSRPDIFYTYTGYNYIQMNPFYPPNPDYMINKASSDNCCCQKPNVRALFNKIWNQ
jgi:hypothetical protein